MNAQDIAVELAKELQKGAHPATKMVVVCDAFITLHSRHASMMRELAPYLRHADNCGDMDSLNNIEPYARTCNCGLAHILSQRAAEGKEEGPLADTKENVSD